MRASRKKGKRLLAIGSSPFAESAAEHISGAEGIYPKEMVQPIVQSYIDRARNHPRGNPDRIHITVEKLFREPRPIEALPVVTLKCASPKQAESYVRRLLTPEGISDKALRAAFSLIRNKMVMRGAALVYALSGRRGEPDKKRGIRASRLGVTRGAEKALAARLRRHNINTPTVKEALVLASKVAAYPDIVAELCVSDDPDYTTGYVASNDLGYVRIPHIKKKKSATGGRVFFLRENSDIASVVRYLEKTSVIVVSSSPCRGTYPIHEIADRHHQ